MENDGRKMHQVMAKADCDKHQAPLDVACWTLNRGTGSNIVELSAVCGPRIRRAGYIGQISTSSLAQKRFPNKKEVK